MGRPAAQLVAAPVATDERRPHDVVGPSPDPSAGIVTAPVERTSRARGATVRSLTSHLGSPPFPRRRWGSG